MQTDPNTNSSLYTNQSSVTLTLGNATALAEAAAYCILEQSNTLPDPTSPTITNACWLNSQPTTVTLTSTGLRKVLIYTKDAAGNVSSSANSTTIDYSTFNPTQPTLLISDTGSGFTDRVQNSNVSVGISNISGVTHWCLSETQTTKPALGTSACSDWNGSTSAWITSSTMPTSYQLSAAEGNKTVYLWIADNYNNVNLIAGSYSIWLDTSAPPIPSSITLQSPTLSPSDDATPSFQIAGLEIGGTVKLYKDSTCSSETSSLSINNTSLLVTATTLTSGTYNFSTKVYDVFSRESGCLAWNSSYILDTAAPTLSAISPNQIPTISGGTITLTGTHFVQGMSVAVASLICNSVTFISNTSISCMAPSFSAVSLNVIATKPTGLAATLNDGITYSPGLPKAPVCFNGFIRAIEPDTSNIYIGGDFTQIGTCTGSGVPLDTITGLIQPSMSNFPKVTGTVKSAISDNNGGFYIGGNFSSVGGQSRYNVARIKSDGSLDEYIGTEKMTGSINSMQLDGSKLYIGGNFTYGEALKSKGALIDPATANINLTQESMIGSGVSIAISDGANGFYIGGDFSWADGGLLYSNLVHLLSDGSIDVLFMPMPDSYVSSLLLSGGTLYVGGSFKTIGGQARNNIAALNAITGAALSWNPNVSASAGFFSAVSTLAKSGSTLYIGGFFNSVGGQTRNNIAAIDTVAGTATTWNPNADDPVSAMVVNGGTLFVGGSFNNIGGQARVAIAALSTTTGAASAWNANVGNTNFSVYSLVLSSATLYVGGWFTSIGGQTRRHIAALNATTAAVTSWNPDAGDANYYVHTLAISGSTIYAGGSFYNIGGQNRTYLAAIDATTGSATNWNPIIPLYEKQTPWAYVDTIAVSGTALYVGGNFTYIGAQKEKYLAALDTSTGSLTDWNPNLDGEAKALILEDNTLYVGGSFSNIGGQARNSIAAIDTSTGLATNWNPNSDGGIYSLLLSGSTLYVGGYFSNIGGEARSNIAALQTSSNMATAWDPQSDSDVQSLALIDSTLYVGGTFNNIGGQSRNYLAAVNTTTGSALAWNPDPNNVVNSLTTNGTTLFAGGAFSTISGQDRNSIAAFNITTGSINKWNPNISGGNINSLALSNSTIYAGGEFKLIDGISRKGITALDKTTGDVTDWDTHADGTVSALALNGSTLYIGGGYTTIGGQARTNLAAVNTSTGSATNWIPNTDGGTAISTFLLNGSTLYVGGSFNSIGGQNRNNIAALDTTTGSASSWNPDSDNWVSSFTLNGSLLYVAGSFWNIGGQARSNLAAIDTTSGLATSWDPNPDSTVSSIVFDDPLLYVGGGFTSIGGQLRTGIAAIDADGLATNFNPIAKTNSFAYTIVDQMISDGNTLYVGGSLTQIGGHAREYVAAIDTTSGSAISSFYPKNTVWEPYNNNIVCDIALSGTTLFIGGSFTSMSNLPLNFSGVDITNGSLNFP
jgi:hypothetical protein